MSRRNEFAGYATPGQNPATQPHQQHGQQHHQQQLPTTRFLAYEALLSITKLDDESLMALTTRIKDALSANMDATPDTLLEIVCCSMLLVFRYFISLFLYYYLRYRVYTCITLFYFASSS